MFTYDVCVLQQFVTPIHTHTDTNIVVKPLQMIQSGVQPTEEGTRHPATH